MARDPALSTTNRDASIRQAIVDKRPDPTDPNVWPSRLAELAYELVRGQDILRALSRVAELTTPDGGVELRLAADAIEKAQETLAALDAISPLTAWWVLHPPRLDPLDGIYDCGHPDCPATGFASPEDKALHYRRWEIES